MISVLWSMAGPGTTEGRQQLRDAIEAARAAGVPPGDLAMAETLEAQAQGKAIAMMEYERATAVQAKERAERNQREEGELRQRQAVVAKNAAAAQAAADKAAAEKAVADKAKAESEMRAAMEEIRSSVKLSGPERKRVLRAMQVKWHPDRQYGDESTTQLAAELSAKVNEAMAIAKKNAKARGEPF